VKLPAGATLAHFAIAVGDALRRHGIRAVLTGGACASVYTGGWHSSVDADFVLLGEVERADLDVAMASLGFTRSRDRYVHSTLDYYVEFPRGPLAIGTDDRIRPVEHSAKRRRTLALSATDCCRDRLAAFYHWNDRQSLAVAVQVASRHRLNWRIIREWSAVEGFTDRYAEFRAAVRSAARRPPAS
jgi:hypothetical protein